MPADLTHFKLLSLWIIVTIIHNMHWKLDPNLYPPYLRARIRRGRGVGEGIRYLPWLNTRDVPSEGTSSKPPGILVPRPYQLLSELEAIYFFLTERKRTTVDIREQWPILDIDRTLELCRQFGVDHRNKGAYPEPFTIDFLITEIVDGKVSHRAASIKTSKDAANPEIRLRLAIEHTWCQERGIPWTLVDTSAFNKTMLAALRFIRAWFVNRYAPSNDGAQRFCEQFHSVYETNILLQELIQKSARRLNLNEVDAQNMFRYCAWYRDIDVSLRHPLSLNRPLVLNMTHATAR